MKILHLICAVVLSCGTASVASAAGISIKYPGMKSTSYRLEFDASGKARGNLPLEVLRKSTVDGDVENVVYTVKAKERCWFSLADTVPTGMAVGGCDFYMPGFWYHRNMRSPEKAPSFRSSTDWSVREDRLSSPLTGVYDTVSRCGVSLMRIQSDFGALSDCVPQNLSGEVMLPGTTSVGSVGFCNDGDKASLVCAFPYVESPKRYIRKLTLIDPVKAFMKLDKDQTVTLSWQIRRSECADYSDFVADTWNYCYDTMKPLPLPDAMSDSEAKHYLSKYFVSSFVDDYKLKFFSGHAMRCDDCISTDAYQVGFVGRVLLNAFNAFEYAEKNSDSRLAEISASILGSVYEYGFTPEGYFIEDVRLGGNEISQELSIRRQSEGAYAILTWLNYERMRGRRHPEWDRRIREVMDRIVAMQNVDGSFPRKFRADGSHIDPTGGSTPSATLPLTMAYCYYKDKRYLESARRTGDYLKTELIDKADYFSSTLDADCEDKEASLYASTAMYYLSRVTKGKERERNLDLCRKAAYFCLSWYYMWDVPFASGQMLGDIGFRSRGWGNVSVENNHIDVFVFDFATVLRKLSEHYGEPRFSAFADVISSSMLQLMPVADNMYDIAKTGYYPEVVQHTTWDYGRNGKGFYNDIFAPGWTVASLWQMLSPDRLDYVFEKR
ncbi:MAG: hypothetical protein K2G24_03735 [Muribaculaceae bacterium]|nr:hypothetical protein [Muribaculaceae bacterium]